MSNKASIVVIGSVNLDISAAAPRLPVAGETVTDAVLSRFPGGKGANQALAARRLGADVSLVACVGKDTVADEALALLREGGVNLDHCQLCEDTPTGVALIAVSADGENQIIVAPGANRRLRYDRANPPTADAVICQLEIPTSVLETLAETYEGFLAINLAPAKDVPAALIERANLVVVNETEAAFYGDRVYQGDGYVAVTYGARGARLFRNREEVAESEPPRVAPVDSTGAGDAFTAALCVALVEGLDAVHALRFACAAGALATTVPGAQPSLPRREDVDQLSG